MSEVDRKRTTIYIPVPADEALDNLVVATGKRKNRLMLEGIDRILEEHGLQPLATAIQKK
ncbi:hypothetical protein [Roseibium aggregatum]|uniref:CopG family transcriptional regulator n=1 Tax=Roseibium aggregatum TaxID=187304 RepID=A0A0M6YD09_9HYPH|nr:hypothetical protein [Roseibium aggregatum]CTQ47309.1 hypothetical protein LAL4801_05771 [Roseibium aggregatum]